MLGGRGSTLAADSGCNQPEAAEVAIEMPLVLRAVQKPGDLSLILALRRNEAVEKKGSGHSVQLQPFPTRNFPVNSLGVEGSPLKRSFDSLTLFLPRYVC